jgi:hypothetical protein
MSTALKHEMQLPNPLSRAVVRIQLVITVLIILFVALAIVNLINNEGVLFSYLWLGLITLLVGNAVLESGGLFRFLINRLGDWFGSPFVEARSEEVHFGFHWLGLRFIQQRIPIERIELVEWSTGQATAMAGHDRDDWDVILWFDHADPTRAEVQRRRGHPKPGQDLRVVGPDGPKARTEAFGLSLVAFLRTAGADLIPGATSTCFVRRSAAGEGQ